MGINATNCIGNFWMDNRKDFRMVASDERKDRLIEQAAKVIGRILYHDERGQGVGYSEAMDDAKVLLPQLKGLAEHTTDDLRGYSIYLSDVDILALREIRTMAYDLRCHTFGPGTNNAIFEGIMYRIDGIIP